jgi:AsmA-like C-terminal region
MSSPAVTNGSTAKTSSHPRTPRRTAASRRALIVALVLAGILLCAAIVFYVKYWPFSRSAVLQDLQEVSDSTVTVQNFHPTYFPPGCVIDGIEFRHGARRFKLITIDKLIVEGSYLGILRKHVPRITAVGTHVIVPAFGSNVTFHTQPSSTVVDELVANGSYVDFESNDPHAQPFRFDVREATLNHVQSSAPIHYRLKFHNPNPPGEIAVSGNFGAWTRGHPEDTPLSGDYTFDHADLGSYGGIAGMLASTGKFGGAFQHIDVSGTINVPDFEVTSGGHKVKVDSTFNAYVDAMHGDTFLKRVDVHFGRTHLRAEGSIAGSKGRKGKYAELEISTRRGRIEDILGLFVKDRAPMSGPVVLRTHAEIAPGDQAFLKKVGLDGGFGVDAGNFSSEETQQDVDKLSAGARGEKMDDPDTVLADLNGRVVLAQGTAHFSDLRFSVPGAKARMQGTYDILNHKIDLHGRMRVDSNISKTQTGFKSLLLKIMDPIFKKKKKGEVVPIHIVGTYEKPQFGLDLTEQEKPAQ